MREQISATNGALREQLLSIQDQLESVESDVAERSLKQSDQETKLRRCEEAYLREKDGVEQTHAAVNKELEQAEARLARLRDTSAEEARIAAAARRTAEARARLEADRLEHQRFKRSLTAHAMDAVSQCAEHRELVQRRLGELRELYRQRVEGQLLGQGLGAGPMRRLLTETDGSVQKENGERSAENAGTKTASLATTQSHVEQRRGFTSPPVDLPHNATSAGTPGSRITSASDANGISFSMVEI